MRAAIGSILKLALAGACIYALYTWQFAEPQGSEVRAFAEKACVDEIRSSYDVSTVRAYSIKENSDGYIVRASITMNKGGVAKVYCLANRHGGVKEISLEQR